MIGENTKNHDDNHKTEQDVKRKQRAKDAEQARQREREQRLLEQSNKARAEANRKAIIERRIAVLERTVTEPEIRHLVVSYGFTQDQDIEQIANDPRWDSLAPGTRTVAWYDLQKRIEKLDSDRQSRRDEAQLAELAATISDIYDRSKKRLIPH